MKVRVQLDWVIDVQGTEDEGEAHDVAWEYLADQEPLEDNVKLSVLDELPDDLDPEEVTVTLYPDDQKVPDADARNRAGAWNTYHRQVTA